MIIQHSGAWNLLVFWMKIVASSRFSVNRAKREVLFWILSASQRWLAGSKKKKAKPALAAPLFFYIGQ